MRKLRHISYLTGIFTDKNIIQYKINITHIQDTISIYKHCHKDHFEWDLIKREENEDFWVAFQLIHSEKISQKKLEKK